MIAAATVSRQSLIPGWHHIIATHITKNGDEFQWRNSLIVIDTFDGIFNVSSIATNKGDIQVDNVITLQAPPVQEWFDAMDN